MKLRKKAASIEFLVTFVILIVILIVALQFTYKITQTNEQASDVERCKQSVELQGLTNLQGFEGGLFNNQVDCPTIYRKANDPDDIFIKKRLSYDLSECWYKFSMGSENIFQALYKEQKYYCTVCSVTEFTGSSQKREITGFSYYLANEQAPLKHTNGRQQTFLEFLQPHLEQSNTPYQDPENPEYQLGHVKESLDPKVDLINTGTPYATLLIFTNKGFNNIIESADTFATAGGITGAIFSITPQGKGIGALMKTAKYVILGYTTGGVAGIITSEINPTQWQAATVLIPYTPEELNKLNCNELPVKQNVRTQKFINPQK